MKTANLPIKAPKDVTSSILRLERNNTEITFLKSKLSSYVCEPKTPKLYERLESLKNRLENMRHANQEAISSLRDRKKNFKRYKGNIARQLKEFKELENNVFEYIGMARMHC